MAHAKTTEPKLGGSSPFIHTAPNEIPQAPCLTRCRHRSILQLSDAVYDSKCLGRWDCGIFQNCVS